MTPARRRRQPGALPDLDQSLPEEVLTLTLALRALRLSSGLSYKQISELTYGKENGKVSTAQLNSIFSPSTKMLHLSTWEVYAATIDVIGGTSTAFEAKWKAAELAFAKPKRGNSAAPYTAAANPQALNLEAAHPHAAHPGPLPDEPNRHVPYKQLGLALTVTILIGAIIVFVQMPSTVSDNTSPTATDCASPPVDEVFYSHLYNDWPADQGPPTPAVIEMHYSPKCRTVWAVLKNATPGATRASLIRVDDGQELDCVADGSGSCSTNQLDDAGKTSFARGASPEARGETPQK